MMELRTVLMVLMKTYENGTPVVTLILPYMVLNNVRMFTSVLLVILYMLKYRLSAMKAFYVREEMEFVKQLYCHHHRSHIVL